MNRAISQSISADVAKVSDGEVHQEKLILRASRITAYTVLICNTVTIIALFALFLSRRNK
jgi:hypothetical protein